MNSFQPGFSHFAGWFHFSTDDNNNKAAKFWTINWAINLHVNCFDEKRVADQTDNDLEVPQHNHYSKYRQFCLGTNIRIWIVLFFNEDHSKLTWFGTHTNTVPLLYAVTKHELNKSLCSFQR